MITLYGSGRRFGLPDASTFVTKTEVLLKMAGVPFQLAKADFRKAPKGKIPYIEDEGRLLGDSTLIRRHLEDKYAIAFDKGLSPAEKAIAWAFEKMCEDHLYWGIVHARWATKDNFERGPKHFFDDVPALLRPIVLAVVSRGVRSSMKGQGFGRHTKEEVEWLSIRDIDAIAAFLGDKPWLMGAEPCGADATVWSSVIGALCPHFETPIRTAAEKHANLAAYAARGMKHWFPELKN